MNPLTAELHLKTFRMIAPRKVEGTSAYRSALLACTLQTTALTLGNWRRLLISFARVQPLQLFDSLSDHLVLHGPIIQSSSEHR